MIFAGDTAGETWKKKKKWNCAGHRFPHVFWWELILGASAVLAKVYYVFERVFLTISIYFLVVRLDFQCAIVFYFVETLFLSDYLLLFIRQELPRVPYKTSKYLRELGATATKIHQILILGIVSFIGKWMDVRILILHDRKME